MNKEHVKLLTTMIVGSGLTKIIQRRNHLKHRQQSFDSVMLERIDKTVIIVLQTSASN